MSSGGRGPAQNFEPPADRGMFQQMRVIFAPPSDEDVLVADEVVYYRAPKHVMSLAEPIAETLAVLIVVVTILAGSGFDGVSIAALLFVASILVIARYVRGRDWGAGAIGALVIVAFVFTVSGIDPLVILPLVGFFFVFRLAFLTLRWHSYEVRYLTNRRIIEATGFLGLRVASMPVARVTDIVLSHTAIGETLGYGELRIESAGANQAFSKIAFLVEPGSFHRLAVRLATKPSKIDPKPFIDLNPGR